MFLAAALPQAPPYAGRRWPLRRLLGPHLAAADLSDGEERHFAERLTTCGNLSCKRPLHFLFKSICERGLAFFVDAACIEKPGDEELPRFVPLCDVWAFLGGHGLCLPGAAHFLWQEAAGYLFPQPL